MESNNLRLCQIWASGSQLYEGKTDEQKRAQEDRDRYQRAERENHVLRQADLVDGGHDDIHYFIETPYY